MKNQLVRAPITATWLWVVLAWAIALNVVVPKVSAADLDIREFGARCDGSDDAYAVQAALDALADGARLAVPCRAGIGPTGIRLRRKKGVLVEGSDGGGFIALAGNADNVLFGVEYCDGCTLRYLAIDSRNLPVAGISINYSNGARIEGNTVENVAYPAFGAILGLGNRGNTYTWNTVSRTGVYRVNGVITDGARGIWLGNPKDIWIEWNPVITNNKLLDIGASAIAVNGVGATVTDNYVERSQGSGVKITPPVGLSGRTVVLRNTCRNNRFSGVQIDSATTAPTLVADNILEQNVIAGVYASEGFTDGEITGNRISGSGEAGIYIYDANGAVIQENDISGGKTGIAFEALRPGAIQDVRLHGNTVAGISGNGLVLLGRGGSMRGLTLASNSFSNIKQYGMQIEELQSGEIVGPSLIANCFSNIGAGTLLDLRPSGGLPAPLTAANCSRPPQTRFRPLRINAGGKTYVDSRRQAWLEDAGLIEGFSYDLLDKPIANTDTPELYRTGRWKEGPLDFTADVPNRVYTVTLKFAEPYFTTRGMRVFDIYINGQLVLPRFDILAHVGPLEALDRSFQVTVNNGKLAIHMVAHADDPMICAIEIQ
jgi:parallel beta-helix repeat protein